ncbi:MAG: NUDIX hydrolase [Actinobacteria bacterium]|nr:NUDIX hydrolase [Actinomycetota bacterium]
MGAEERKPVTPRPAASVVLMRRGGKHGQRALEVLLLRRDPEASFFPGAWVFPGGACDPEDGEGPDAYRACAIRELREEAGIELAEDDEMVPFCRFITPEMVPRRYDAWFFLALAPAHTPPQVDGSEIVDARWVRPAAALASADDGGVGLPFPTRIQLGWLAEHATSNDALAAYRGRSVEPLIPEVISEGEETRVVLPGIADSTNITNLVEELPRPD